MSEIERLRKEYDAAVQRRHGKIGATGLEIRADALITALESENERLRQELVAFMDHAEKCHACGQYDDCEPFWDDEPTPRPTEGGECD